MNAPLFAANLAAVVLGLVLTIRAGLAGRRRAHFRRVAGTVVLLGLAILQAEVFGRGFRFDPGRLKLHLTLATAALVLLPAVGWTGLGLARGRLARRTHRGFVTAFVSLVGLAVLSAVWMFWNAVPVD
ncbi:MAG: hypothetical protein ACE5H3_10325 [Planctomycetota bacterium]